MPETTPKGYPYPLGTDRVMDGDDAIHALATAVDTKLGVAAAGQVNIPTSGPQTVAVVFPTGRFTAEPWILVSALAGASTSNPTVVGVTAVTVNGFTVSAARAAGGQYGVNWAAFQI